MSEDSDIKRAMQGLSRRVLGDLAMALTFDAEPNHTTARVVAALLLPYLAQELRTALSKPETRDVVVNLLREPEMMTAVVQLVEASRDFIIALETDGLVKKRGTS